MNVEIEKISTPFMESMQEEQWRLKIMNELFSELERLRKENLRLIQENKKLMEGIKW